MLNLTIFSLISSNIYQLSPCFVHNQLSLNQCQFTYFFPTIFYDPQRLSLKNSKFQYGLGSILYAGAEGEIIRDTIKDQTFNTLIPIDFQQYQSKKGTLSIINCIFDNIRASDGDSQEALLLIQTRKFTIYMTDLLFKQCKGRSKLILSQNIKSTEITHTCFLSCTSTLFDLQTTKLDFTQYTYTTHHNCEAITDNSDQIILVNDGYQYYRCNNFSHTKSKQRFFLTQRPICISLKYFTFHNINVQNDGSYLIEMSNGNAEDYGKEPRYFQYINFVNNDNQYNIPIYFRLAGGFSYTTTIQNSIFIYEKTPKIFIREKDDQKLILSNCFFKKSYQTDPPVETTNCILDSNGTPTIEIAHFTTLGCEGPVLAQPINAKSCGANDPFEGDKCNGTYLTFPSDAVPFTPVIHPEIQSNYFTPSSFFTHSDTFTRTRSFTASSIFSATNVFEKTIEFTKSRSFTKSSVFAASSVFTSSHKYSQSNDFTGSNTYSKSNEFTETVGFTASNKFDSTKEFSNSQSFTPSDGFTKSNTYSKSNEFTGTVGFTASNKFDSTKEFSNSQSFTTSEGFTKSKPFSFSEYFTKSDSFHPTPGFDATKTFPPTRPFSQSQQFTQSKQFTRSKSFTKSIGFSVSNLFTKSNIFTISDRFDATQYFTQSKKFTQSNSFTVSNSFTQSSSFTPSSMFTASSVFTQSDHFDRTNAFSPSSHFTPSLSFTLKPIDIDIDQFEDSSNKSSLSIKPFAIAGGIIAGLVLIIIAIVFLSKRKKYNIIDSSTGIVEIETKDTAIVTHNDLRQMLDEDDPFADDFQNEDFAAHDL